MRCRAATAAAAYSKRRGKRHDPYVIHISCPSDLMCNSSQSVAKNLGCCCSVPKATELYSFALRISMLPLLATTWRALYLHLQLWKCRERQLAKFLFRPPLPPLPPLFLEASPSSSLFSSFPPSRGCSPQKSPSLPAGG